MASSITIYRPLRIGRDPDGVVSGITEFVTGDVIAPEAGGTGTSSLSEFIDSTVSAASGPLIAAINLDDYALSSLVSATYLSSTTFESLSSLFALSSLVSSTYVSAITVSGFALSSVVSANYLSSNVFASLSSLFALSSVVSANYVSAISVSGFALSSVVSANFLSSNQFSNVSGNFALSSVVSSNFLSSNQFSNVSGNFALSSVVSSNFLSSNQFSNVSGNFALSSVVSSNFLSSNQFSNVSGNFALSSVVSANFLSSTGGTLTGSVSASNGVAFLFTEYDYGTSAGTISIDLRNGNKQVITLSGNTTFTFASAVAPIRAGNFVLRINQDSTGGRTIAFNATTVDFGDAGEPTWSTVADSFNLLFIYYPGSTNRIYCSGSTGFSLVE